jgi:hypothetical protein
MTETCKGYRYDYKTKETIACTAKCKPNSKFCGNHKYFENLDKYCENLDFTKLRICKKCRRYVDYGEIDTACDPCSDAIKVNNAKNKIKTIANRCNHYDRYQKACIDPKINDTQYCKTHQYMNDYTEDQKNNLKQCSGCRHYKFLDDKPRCEKCCSRKKPLPKSLINCEGITKKGSPCTVSANHIFEQKNYCKLHLRIAEQISNGFKSCSSCGRYNVKDNKTCDICKTLDSNQSKKKIKNDINNAMVSAGISDDSTYCPCCKNTFTIDKFYNEDGNELLVCTNCVGSEVPSDLLTAINKYSNMSSHEFYFGYSQYDLIRLEMQYGTTKMNCTKCKQEYKLFKDTQNRPSLKYCVQCYANNLVKCRNRTRIKYYSKWENSEARLKSRKIWRENNYDKVALAWIKYRSNKILRLGIDEYRKQNAEYSSKWREDNPEKQHQINMNSKMSFNQRYTSIITSAKNRGIYEKLSKEFAKDLINDVCFYCGETEEGSINGIDRVDNNKDYIEDNCVSSCKVCNYMKGELDYIDFLKKIEHICWFQQLCEMAEKQWDYCLTEHNVTDFKGYKNRAEQNKKIDFELIEKDYFDLINEDCYICGRHSTIEKPNGIDRVNNDKGYILDNVKPCCSQCNYIKYTYSLDKLYDKCLKICTTTIERICNTIIDNENIENNIESNINTEPIIDNTMNTHNNDNNVRMSAADILHFNNTNRNNIIIIDDSNEDVDENVDEILDMIENVSNNSNETKKDKYKRYRETQKNKVSGEEYTKYECDRKARQRNNKKQMKPVRVKLTKEEKKENAKKRKIKYDNKIINNASSEVLQSKQVLEVVISRYNNQIKKLNAKDVLTPKEQKSLDLKLEKIEIKKKELDELKTKYNLKK